MSVTQASLLGDTFGSRASGTIPVGGIIMWSGSIASIPTGWRLCNGANGTPNLQNKFVVGAGSEYAVAATGGSADAIVVSHTHTVEDPGHAHNFTAVLKATSNTDSGDGDREPSPASKGTTEPAETGITIDPEGEDGTGKNLPPYYALAFIMRVS